MAKAHFDGPFWVALIAGLCLVGAAGLMGHAAAAQNAAHVDTPLVAQADGS